MTRHLIPRIDIGRWGGGALTVDPVDGLQDDIAGACIVIQWLGLLIEIGIGRVRNPRAPWRSRAR